MKQVLSKVLDFLGDPVKVAILAFLGVALGTLFSSSNNPTQASVKIMAASRRSGGSGVVISSTSNKSVVLTNSHVCRIVEHGGLVEGVTGIHLVATYKHSKFHDLCMITVNSDLRASTKVAGSVPSQDEKASITGHPALFPTTTTYGHFSGNAILPVMTGFKKCTDKDREDPDKSTICMFIGVIPIVKVYESQLVTATIMPGSSGSPVYDSDKNLAGLVFAGQGDLGYAWTVPFDAVTHFLQIEAKTLAENPVGAFSINDGASEEPNFSETIAKIKNECQKPEVLEKMAETCKIVKSDALWRK